MNRDTNALRLAMLLACAVSARLALAQDAEVHTAPQGYAPEPYRLNTSSRPSHLEENHIHLLALREAEEQFGTDGLDIVPAIRELASWYVESDQCLLAIPPYRHVLEIEEAAYGTNDLRLVEPLSDVAKSCWCAKRFRGEGLEARERIVRLYDGAQDWDGAVHARALVDLGDWYLVTHELDDAIATYRRAWKYFVEANAGSAALAQRELGQPAQILGLSESERLDLVAGSTTSPEDEIMDLVRMELDVTIAADGASSDPALADADGVMDLNRRLRIAKIFMSHARFRPALVDGRPREMRFRWKQTTPKDANASDPGTPPVEPGTRPPAQR